ncbi:type II secretion system protein [Vibrio harveyi]|uniref:type II secretion system protein n=1 Tax=Vibrio harveyi TaxID=669 RepID=UPI003CEDC3BB
MKRQRGFALMAGLLLALGVLSVGCVYFAKQVAKQRVINNSESFYNRVLYLKQQIHAYASNQYINNGYPINGKGIFPQRLQDLERDGFFAKCSDTDNQKGLCMKVTQTPWGEIADKDYNIVGVPTSAAPDFYRAEVTLRLPAKSGAMKFERNATLSLFSQMPNIVYDETENTITVRIDRPDKAFSYEGLVKRSGDDSTLLGDWDIGGEHAIMNAKDYTLKNADGSQTLVSQGLSHFFTAKHQDKVPKPRCPVGLKPSIKLALGYIEINKKYQLVGSQKPYLITSGETASEWQVGLEIRVKNLDTGDFDTANTGEIIAITQCRR